MSFRNIELALIMIIALSVPTSTWADTITQFQATLAPENLSSNPSNTFSGVATFTLVEPTIGLPTLQYDVELSGIDINLDGILPNRHDSNISNQSTDEMDDLWGMHIHHAPVGNAGPHVLNILGRPANDDADVSVDFVNEMLSGLWDDSDFSGTSPPNTKKLSDFIAELKNEELFLITHTWGTPNSSGLAGGGAIGGRIRVAPEPATGILALLMVLTALTPRRRSKR